jgi:hypothetical protein
LLVAVEEEAVVVAAQAEQTHLVAVAAVEEEYSGKSFF